MKLSRVLEGGEAAKILIIPLVLTFGPTKDDELALKLRAAVMASASYLTKAQSMSEPGMTEQERGETSAELIADAVESWDMADEDGNPVAPTRVSLLANVSEVQLFVISSRIGAAMDEGPKGSSTRSKRSSSARAKPRRS